MKTRVYNPPDFSILNIDMSDIITTSEIEAGVETTPVPDKNSTWETL